MMRTPVKSAGDTTAASTSVPAPVGGWNARDSYAAMPAKDAIILDNLFPRATDVTLRKGSALFATLPPDIILTPHAIRGLLPYSPTTGGSKLFASANDGIYDITAGGAVAVASTPATSAAWQSSMVTTAGGAFMWCCNGVDKSRYFNGVAWTVLDGASVPSLTGIDSTKIKQTVVFKSRLLLVEVDSMSFWYLPPNSIAGLAVEYPCGELFDLGGKIAAVASWTVDAGNGADDLLCVITTEGEVAVFSGTDLASVSNWSLQGIYKLAKPMGDRCTFKYGGDLCLITNNGILPMSTELLSATLDRSKSPTDKISQAFNSYALAFGGQFGWQGVVHSEGSALLINVPLGYKRSYQFVMNTLTKAWCRFIGWDAEVMCVCGGKLFTAASNKVYQAWIGDSDNGAVISVACKTSFNTFGKAGIVKQVSMLRPIFTASASLHYSLGIDSDYSDNNFAESATTIAQDVSQWDTAKWDEAVWTSGSITVASWRSVNHKPGRALAVRLRLSAKNVTFTWSATDLILKPGGLL